LVIRLVTSAAISSLCTPIVYSGVTADRFADVGPGDGTAPGRRVAATQLRYAIPRSSRRASRLGHPTDDEHPTSW